jgi:hypothetical protein
MKGKTFSDSARANMGRKAGFISPKIGIPRTLEVRVKISQRLRVTAVRGEKAPGYIDGKGVERKGERISAEAKQWAYDVKMRDEFFCHHCGDDSGGNLQAHHIKPFATHPELRLDLSNGITVCEACHWLVHRYDIPGFY